MDTFSERDPEAVESSCIQARRADAQREQRHQVLGRLVGHVPLPHRSDRSVTQPCAAAPLVLSTIQVFSIMTCVFALAGWPVAARGVRAIVRVERTREYAEAARSLGASSTRILFWHLLPATRGFLVVQATLLVPAFILAEATMSFIGLGFTEPSASWGVMLQEAGRGHALAETPWLLAPAAAIVLAVFGLNLLAGERIFETAASGPVLKPLK